MIGHSNLFKPNCDMNRKFEESDLEEEIEFEYVLDFAKPLVLLLGWVDHEGILSALKSSGRQYKKKILSSYPKNWEAIADLFDNFKISAVVGKLAPEVLELIVHEDYLQVRDRLFQAIGAVPNQIYLYEDVFDGEQADKFREEYSPYPDRQTIERAIEFLRSCGLELVPYKRRADVTVLAEAFLSDIDRNLIFRLYVPSGRLWSGEADTFLQLFQDYLARVDQLKVRLDQKRTDHGAIYEFHGQPPEGKNNLTQEFNDFSQLMNLCASDTDAAASLLASKHLDPRETSRLLTRYSKEAKRLQLDIKHEAESKIIAIRQRLESEFLDLDPSPEDWQAINSFIDLAIPLAKGILSLPIQSVVGTSQRSAENLSNVTYNFRPQFIGTLNGVIADEIHGNQHFSKEHHQLLELVSQHGGAHQRELETAVYELADKGVDKVDRLKAKQRLTAFLIAVGKKTGDVAAGIIQKYIEHQLGL